jgi:hypothetical protein
MIYFFRKNIILIFGLIFFLIDLGFYVHGKHTFHLIFYCLGLYMPKILDFVVKK